MSLASRTSAHREARLAAAPHSAARSACTRCDQRRRPIACGHRPASAVPDGGIELREFRRHPLSRRCSSCVATRCSASTCWPPLAAGRRHLAGTLHRARRRATAPTDRPAAKITSAAAACAHAGIGAPPWHRRRWPSCGRLKASTFRPLASAASAFRVMRKPSVDVRAAPRRRASWRVDANRAHLTGASRRTPRCAPLIAPVPQARTRRTDRRRAPPDLHTGRCLMLIRVSPTEASLARCCSRCRRSCDSP